MIRKLQLGVVLVLLASAQSAAPRAQTAQRAGEGAPTGLLMGVVVDALDNQPVANAEVRLGGAPQGTRNTVVLADEQGRFVFMPLPKGTFTITATRPGYADGAYGRLRPMGLPQALTLAEGEHLADLKIPIWKFAAVTGRVTDEAGEPVIGVAVRALQRAIVAGRQKLVPGPTARTDDRGVYRISSLVPGDYAVVVPSTQASAPDSIIDLWLQRRMSPGATKPGESDLNRDLSFSGAMDSLLVIERNRGTHVGGQSFVSIGAGSRGAVPPARSASNRLYVYPTQYHPAAAAAALASLVTLQSGEERVAIDIQLSLTPASSVSGSVKGPDGPLMVALTLVPESDDLSADTGFETATTLSDAAGRFTFAGVPEGRYRMRATLAQVPVSGASRGAPPPPRSASVPAPATPLPALGGFTLWATQSIAVGATDVADLAVTMRPGFRISGRAEFAGSQSQPDPDVVRRMTTTFDQADARALVSTTIGRGQFDERGQLSSYQLPPGRYYVRVNNIPAGWVLKNAMWNGRDASNVPLLVDADVSGLVITFTDRPSTLSGHVQSAGGASDGSATVLVFPAEPATWSDYGNSPRRLVAIRVDRNGSFETPDLPSGSYLSVAIPETSSANWQDPRNLRALARLATAITLADGERKSIALKTVAVPR